MQQMVSYFGMPSMYIYNKNNNTNTMYLYSAPNQYHWSQALYINMQIVVNRSSRLPREAHVGDPDVVHGRRVSVGCLGVVFSLSCWHSPRSTKVSLCTWAYTYSVICWFG